MIYDTFDNAAGYNCEKLNKAIDFARNLSADAECGRIEIDGDDMFAMLSTYETLPVEKVPFEAHKKYIDVQILLAGEEIIGVTQDTDLAVKQPYSDENDCALYEPPAASTKVLLKPGLFVLLNPQDAHQPCTQLNGPAAVRKLVVKIKV